MEIIVFEKEAYHKMQKEMIDLVIKTVSQKLPENDADGTSINDWVTETQAMKILPYRSKTKWQELRDRGEVVFSQFGRKILYNKASLLDLIKKNKIQM